MSKWKDTMISKLGEEGYKEFMFKRGSRGGRSGSNSAWALSPEGQAHMSEAGKLGGKISRKRKS